MKSFYAAEAITPAASPANGTNLYAKGGHLVQADCRAGDRIAPRLQT